MDYVSLLRNINMHFIALEDQGKLFGYIALTEPTAQPAIGGLRILYQPYTKEITALCGQLASTMQLKAKACNLPLSGGKAVIYSCIHTLIWLIGVFEFK